MEFDVEELKTERLVMMIDRTTLANVDEWGFSNRMRTRAKAVRTLIRKGLEAASAENEKGEATA